MPTSDPANISPIIAEVLRLQPRSVLDLGIGAGKYGGLIREYIPQAHIIGVEAFPGYMNPMWDCYNAIYLEDFTQANLGQHYIDNDLVLMIDSLEHQERGTGEAMLDFILRNNKHLIVSTPNGDYPQGAVNGNPFEEHKSTWTVLDFMRASATIIHTGVCVVASIKGNK